MAVDVLDVLTAEEAEQAVNLPNNSPRQAAALEQAVTAVSRLLDDLCGPVVRRTITDELHYASGTDRIEPKYTPISSVTTATEYVSGTGTVLTAESVTASGTYLILDNAIHRRTGFNGVNFSGAVKLTYVAGRYATTATVDAKFKRAAAEILQGNWSKYAAAWARGGDPFADPVLFDEVTRVIDRWLWAERRPPAIA